MRRASVEEARRAAGGAAVAGGGVRDQQPVLGAGGGDVEQPALLGEPLGVGAGQRSPRRQQPLLAADEHDEQGLRAFGAVDGRDGDAAVLLARLDLLGVQAGGVLEKAGEGRLVALLVVVGLGGAAQRAQVLEHAFGVATLVRVGRAVAALLEVAHEAAFEHHGGEHDVPDGAAVGELGADVLERGAEPGEPVADRLLADRRELVRAGAGGDQVAGVLGARQRDDAVGGASRRRRAAGTGRRAGTPARPRGWPAARGRRARRGPRRARTGPGCRARGAGCRPAPAPPAPARWRSRCGRAPAPRSPARRPRACRRSARRPSAPRRGRCRTRRRAPARRGRASRSAPWRCAARCARRRRRRRRGSPPGSGSCGRARSGCGRGAVRRTRARCWPGSAP